VVVACLDGHVDDDRDDDKGEGDEALRVLEVDAHTRASESDGQGDVCDCQQHNVDHDEVGERVALVAHDHVLVLAHGGENVRPVGAHRRARSGDGHTHEEGKPGQRVQPEPAG